ncbi:hypothetical protein PRUPE_4G245900 [Prunus persica]|uniref:1-acylglycerol-3-phosphate O-acyltransferase n=1 Tax=Prunus persica TaxID=3760 RepID=A0A251PQE1_PRUPE|nr:hypothetical protein PRUPE_4G245900 [Prunus persica]
MIPKRSFCLPSNLCLLFLSKPKARIALAAMAIPAVLAIVPIGVVFILSGLIVNLMQVVSFILLRPISKKLYRKINKVVAELLWLELIWLIDWWAGIKVELYVDSDTFQLMGKEHALVICNHRSDIDWLVGWLVAQRSGCLGSALAIMKKEVMFLPVIGWSMWFSEYFFLERRWTKDEITLKSGFQQLEDFPMPFWLALFVEGTRFTQAKLMVAQEFAASRGLPIPRNVLLPRTKGFVSSVSQMRSFVPAIYDCTVAVPKNQPPPTLLRIFRGQSSVVKLQIRRHSMQELPETADGIGQWCKDVFVTKVVLLWSCLIGYGIFKFVPWSSLLSSWKGIAFSATFLVLVVIVMQILIHSSESERSTPLNITPQDQTKERLVQK